MEKSKKYYKKRKFIIAALLAVIAEILLFVLILFNFYIDISGIEENQTIEYGSIYEEKEPSVKLKGRIFFKNGSVKSYTKSGFIDTSKPGEYTVTYSAKYFFWSAKKSVTVRVVDNVSPIIELQHIDGYYTLPNTEYQEEGYKATDNCDGDITDAVIRKIEGDVVYYSVEDSSGNKTTVSRKIIYNDTVAPEITILGEADITINVGGSYEEYGCKAMDNCDGDITSKVVVEGTINTEKPGSYTIRYSVSDSYGNEAEALRTVQVMPVLIRDPVTVAPGNKVIYLTFDDGPSKYTEKLLAVLDKYNVKATFFCVNGIYNNIIAKEVAMGHSVGVHSTTHDYKQIYENDEAFLKDMHNMQDIIYEQTGKRTTLMRFPGGSSNQISAEYNKGIMSRLSITVRNEGFQYFDWNVSSGDAGGTTKTSKVIENVIEGIKKNNVSVVLQHDSHGFSVDAVEDIIVWGIENGYTFLPLDMSSPAAHHRIYN